MAASLTDGSGASRGGFALSRVYAYSVIPQKHVEDSERVAPSCGPIRLTKKGREVIDNAFKKIAASAITTVDLEFDGARAHPVRDNVMGIAQGRTTFAACAAPYLRAARGNSCRSYGATS